MGKSCAYIPSVKNTRGEIVPSKLFSDILKFTGQNRVATKKLYYKVNSNQFKKDWGNKLKKDSNGEYTLKSIIENLNISHFISSSDILNQLNKDIGGKRSDGTVKLYNKEERESLLDKAIDFNDNNEYKDSYVATVTNENVGEANSKYTIRVQKKTDSNKTTPSRLKFNTILNRRLVAILESVGIGVEYLTDLEEKMGTNGVADFTQAKYIGEDLINLIRIAHGEKGQMALPEEFSHIALAALHGNPLVERLRGLLSNNLSLVADILGTEMNKYVKLYKGDEEMLVEEAMGKLVAKHLFSQEPIIEAPYKSLLQRIIDAIKGIFKKLKASDVRNAMLDADSAAGDLARKLVTGEMTHKMDTSKLQRITMAMHQIAKESDDKVELLKYMIETESKKLAIYEGRTKDKDVRGQVEAKIRELRDAITMHEEAKGIHDYVAQNCKSAEQLLKRLKDLGPLIGSESLEDLNKRALLLRNIRDYFNSINNVNTRVEKALAKSRLSKDNSFGEATADLLSKFRVQLENVRTLYNENTRPIAEAVFRAALGEGIKLPNGIVVTPTTVIQDVDGDPVEADISWFDRWLDSAGDSRSMIIKIFDDIVKKQKMESADEAITWEHAIKTEGAKLEAAGVKDFDWMYEDDNMHYVTEVDWAKYIEASKKESERLRKKYGKTPTDINLQKFIAEKRAWKRTHFPKGSPSLTLYGSEKYKKLMSDNSAQGKAKRAFYTFFMNTKKTMDGNLREYAPYHNSTIKIRRDLIERVTNTKDVKDGARHLWESIKDNFLRRADDTYYQESIRHRDFENREIQTLPIYYTKLGEKDRPQDISTDAVSTLIAYAAMSIDYKHMNSIIHTLEVARDHIQDNMVLGVKKGDFLLEGKWVNTSIDAKGETIERKVKTSYKGSNLEGRLNDFFDMQVYSRYIADEGDIFGMPVAKVVDALNRASSLTQLGFNVLTGFSNIDTGRAMANIEATCGRWFDHKDLWEADKFYSKHLAAHIAELGSRNKTSFLSLWYEKFNVLQDYEMDIKMTNWDRRALAKKIFNVGIVYTFNNIGEHWMQGRTSFALAHRYKLKDKNGKEITLLDAYEIKYADPKNKRLGATLELKEGVTKLDGTKFTDKDRHAFMRMTHKLNGRMHGYYNFLDRNAAQRLAIGRLVFLYRKWIVPGLERRFRHGTYDFDLQGFEEGYWRTFGGLLANTYKDLRQGQFNLIKNFRNLSTWEKQNIWAAITETAYVIGTGALILLLYSLGSGSGDKDRSWLSYLLEYRLRRLFTELAALSPAGGPYTISEALRVIESPAASVQTIENVLSVLSLTNPFNYEFVAGEDALVQSGKYEGKSRAFRTVVELPTPLNYWETIQRIINVDDQIQYFKNSKL